MHSIGIDFGTTKTLVSHINPQTGNSEYSAASFLADEDFICCFWVETDTGTVDPGR